MELGPQREVLGIACKRNLFVIGQARLLTADDGLCVFGVAPGGRLHEVNCITCVVRLETSPTVPEGII